MMFRKWVFSLLFSISFSPWVFARNSLVLETDFGVKDGAVSEMRGVIQSVNSDLYVSDLTHEIPPFDIWEAGYRLYQTFSFWPPKTVFVVVVDPGVGTTRKPIVARTKSQHYFVLPDNGILTLLDEDYGPLEVREIDTKKHLRPGSEKSHTFHGRDLFAYVGAKIAAGQLSFDEVGPVLKKPLERLPYKKPAIENSKARAQIVALDPNYGNVWTNLTIDLAKSFGLEKGKVYQVKILKGKKTYFNDKVPLVDTFGDVKPKKPLLYWNSLMRLSLALNLDDFARTYGIKSGPEWEVQIAP